MSHNRIGAYRHILCLCFFSIGVISLHCTEKIFHSHFYVAVAIGGVIMTAITALLNQQRHSKLLLHVFCVCFLGHAWAGWTAAEILDQQLAEFLQKQDIVVDGQVHGLVRQTRTGISFNFDVFHGTYEGKLTKLPPRIRLSVYDPEFFPKAGESWRMTVRLKKPYGLSNPGSGFYREAFLFYQRIGAVGYVKPSTAQRLAVQDEHGGLGRKVNRLRRNFTADISQALNSDRNAGLIAALVTGVRSGLQSPDWQVLQRTGTAHLVAISGLHIGLVAGFISLLAGAIWRQSCGLCNALPAPLAGMAVGLIGASVYGLVAGFTLPTQRALIMLLVVVIAMVCKRRVLSFETLVVAMAVVLMVDPISPISMGFWMSFAAVAILLVIGKSSAVASSNEGVVINKLRGYFTGWLRIQIWLLVAMVPLGLVGFQKVSLVAPLANFVAVPVIGVLVLPIALASLLIYFVGAEEAAMQLLIYSEPLIAWLWYFLDWLSDSWMAVVQPGLPSSWRILLAASGILFLLVARGMSIRWVGVVWMLPLFTGSSQVLQHGEFRLTMLDVGQGLSVVVKTASHALVYDTGAAYPGGFSFAKVALLPFLRQSGVNRIDRLIVSHGDNDHIGGVNAVFGALAVRAVSSSVPDHPAINGSAIGCQAGQRWRWDGVVFEVLWPTANNAKKASDGVALSVGGNDASCVVSVRSSFGSALLTGDIERRAERALAGLYGTKLAHDLMTTPHHGSKTSSTTRFLDRVSPQIALTGSGYLSRYGHPHPQVVERYMKRKIRFVTTAQDGALTADFRHSGLTVSTHRDTHRRFWKSSGIFRSETFQTRVNHDADLIANVTIQSP